VRLAARTVRRLFAERPDAHVLHEPACEQLEQLEEFVACLSSDGYVPDGRIERSWDARREYLMGRRRDDGRTLEVGKLLSLRLVELVRATGRWGASPPMLIDTPWIPTFHNARRADLILREAARADLVLITALPEPFELEPWVRQLFAEREGIRARTLVVFNQVDTIDTSCLFGRGGFAEAWRDTRARLEAEGIDAANLFVSCARLPFLEGMDDGGARSEFEAARERKLRAVLEKIRGLVSHEPADELTAKLLAACDPADCGVESVRRRLTSLAAREVRMDRARAACEAIATVDELALEATRAARWPALRARAAALAPRLRESSGGKPRGSTRAPTLPDGRPLFK
jgi:hypothetical protein